MTDDAVIQVEHLVAQYGEDRILDDVSFKVKKGEIFIILGGSGCGKSTLLRHLVGLDRPYAGQVMVAGNDIADETTYRETLRRIGVLFQSSALIGSMTVAQNVALPVLEYSGLPRRLVKRAVMMKLGLVGLECHGDHLPAEISGGMKKRAGLARALAFNPQILFLDEPSAGLDPITSAEIDDLILDINHNLSTTMVIVTHELDSIFRLAQRIIMLDKSTKGIIAEGDPADLRDHSDNAQVRRFFNRNRDSADEGTTGAT